MAVVNAWIELKRNGVAEVRARLRSDPQTWRSVWMLDLRNTHGVVLTIGWVGDGAGSMRRSPRTPRRRTPPRARLGSAPASRTARAT